MLLEFYESFSLSSLKLFSIQDWCDFISKESIEYRTRKE